MLTIKNSKGQQINVAEDVSPHRNVDTGELLGNDEFLNVLHKKYNGKLRGYELMKKNANGDIAADSQGYQYATDRMSFIRSKMVEQSFYEVLPSDFFTVIPGEGAFSQNIITNLSIKSAGGFRQGKIGTANNNSGLAVAQAGVVPVYTYVQNWALAIEYSIFDVNQAAFSGNWDPVEAKHRARKKDWDLGIQYVSFLGDLDDLTNFPGLLTQSSVNINLSLYPTNISSMSAAQLSAWVAGVIGAYQANCNYTVYPNRLAVPQDDFNGLGNLVPGTVGTYPISILEFLEKAFKAICGAGFKIMPLAYGIAAQNTAAGVNKQRCCLYRDDIDTLFLELPVDYQTTQVGTLNNFQFQDVAYGQYAGLTVLKPLQLLYLDH